MLVVAPFVLFWISVYELHRAVLRSSRFQPNFRAQRRSRPEILLTQLVQLSAMTASIERREQCDRRLAAPLAVNNVLYYAYQHRFHRRE